MNPNPKGLLIATLMAAAIWGAGLLFVSHADKTIEMTTATAVAAPAPVDHWSNDPGPLQGQWLATGQAAVPSDDAPSMISCTYMDGVLVAGDPECSENDPAVEPMPSATPTPHNSVAVIPVRTHGLLPTAIIGGR